MARHVWSVLCERVIVDEETRGISMIDAAEEVLVEGRLPEETVAVPIDLALVSFWVNERPGEKERGETRFAVRAPGGRELDQGAGIKVDLGEDGRAQTVGRIEVMPLLGAGRYEFVVQYRREGDETWRECAQVPLDVGESEKES